MPVNPDKRESAARAYIERYLQPGDDADIDEANTVFAALGVRSGYRNIKAWKTGWLAEMFVQLPHSKEIVGLLWECLPTSIQMVVQVNGIAQKRFPRSRAILFGDISDWKYLQEETKQAVVGLATEFGLSLPEEVQ